MRRLRAVLLLLAAGCGTSTSPAPEDVDAWVWVERYAERLERVPEDVDALRGLVLHLIECDARVMASMREFHGTGAAAMQHSYRTHRWIHPFIRGFIQEQQGRRVGAWDEFRTAADAAGEHIVRSSCFGDERTIRVAAVVADQSRRGLNR